MHDLAPYIITGVIAALGWLLRQKDASQEKEIQALREQHAADKRELEAKITVLFAKHDTDAAGLQDLRVAIAEGHYKKTELDFKFDKLELAITNSFTMLGGKFDKLFEVLVDHISKEDSERKPK